MPDSTRRRHASRAGRRVPHLDRHAEFDGVARTAEVQDEAREIRDELGDPKLMLLGVDRLDYTKGIDVRLQAFDELLDDGSIAPDDAVLVQIATPSRESVEHYQRLRDEIEQMVGRINGDHGTHRRTRRSTTCTSRFPARSSRRSTSPPTSCSSRRCATA